MQQKQVAILESRMGAQLASLVAGRGGVPFLAPALAELPDLDHQAIGALVRSLDKRPAKLAIFQTGVGTAALLRDAEQRGRLADVLTAVAASTLVCRGPKPTAVVRRHGLEPTIIPQKPFTTKEILEALEPIELAGKAVALVHYGERNIALAEALRARGARLAEACPYEWALP